MKVLLVKPRFEGIFQKLSLIKVEPLELEYLQAICDNANINCQICDLTISGTHLKRDLKQFTPDVVAITANFVHIDVIKRYADQIKKHNSNIKIIVGGPHAEVIPTDFFFDNIDVITYSGGFKPFEKLIQNGFGSLSQLKGIYFQENRNWIKNEKEIFNVNELPFPNRKHFYENLMEYRYISSEPWAILKAAYSCPHNCNYCFSTLLNDGQYSCREPENVVQEIKEINCDNIWIVDDTFYVNRNKVLEFIDLIKKESIHKNYSLYYRADFIANNPDIIIELGKIGVKMIIVGLEVIDDEVLKLYNKKIDVDLINKAIATLKEAQITCVGLFMIDIDVEKSYFKKLYNFIKTNGLYLSTISILTPMPGTQQYEKYKDRITTNDFKKWDFVHLTMNPGKLSRFVFYFEFHKLYVKLAWLNIKHETIKLSNIKTLLPAAGIFWIEAFKTIKNRKTTL